MIFELRFKSLPSIHRQITDLIILVAGMVGFYWYFYQSYGPRLLLFIAAGLAIISIWAAIRQDKTILIPIQVFLLGTWSYNAFQDQNRGLIGIMVIYFFLLAYSFWSYFNYPTLSALNLLHWLYLTLAMIVVWELAVVIQLFWQVEPWSRTFLVVAALVFLQIALKHRLANNRSLTALVVPMIIILMLIGFVISSTPIDLGR